MKTRKKDIMKSSPKINVKSGAPGSRVNKKIPFSVDRPGTRTSAASESKKKGEKASKAYQDKSTKPKADRLADQVNSSTANLSMNTSSDSPTKNTALNDGNTNAEGSESLTENHSDIQAKQLEIEQPIQDDSPDIEADGALEKQFSIAQYYKKEKGRINIWTYLFKSLYHNINELHSMCEKERKVEFNNGVISTLESAVEDFKKLNYKLEVDKLYAKSSILPNSYNSDKAQALAWDISMGANDIANKDELENCYYDLEDPDTVDFTLLTDLVSEGKMSCSYNMVFYGLMRGK